MACNLLVLSGTTLRNSGTPFRNSVGTNGAAQLFADGSAKLAPPAATATGLTTAAPVAESMLSL